LSSIHALLIDSFRHFEFKNHRFMMTRIHHCRRRGCPARCRTRLKPASQIRWQNQVANGVKFFDWQSSWTSLNFISGNSLPTRRRIATAGAGPGGASDSDHYV
jgi:hypothetical protein